ncbi:cytochrome c oxidase accessory protein CcoG [Desertivirga brevis]|uniref:cytochrome c oxidase accessory protein CcoG n=1 Tax=Desertivirga brevis TaxID=2810310 RepID=UPI001A977CD4|nr:cytochrome c oxidase accessory protein CcoG [Pedobacter sp. SYSU D00873]
MEVTFRDRTSTVTEDGKNRRWIYPKIIKGAFYRYRTWLSYVLLTLLFTGPFIKLNEEQLILLNIIERKFVFFGVVFLPQDFYIFVLASLTFLVFVLLFTLVFGRVWCGWACPQTIFMEMLFRKIEIWIEGDASKQKKLNASPLTGEKLFKKSLKHSIFIVLSFLIANIFLAYIIGSAEVLKIINEPITQHIAGFISIVIFTILFYLVFSKLRELVCVVICPYGRLQGVLLDSKSLVVAYDYIRGEPRGKRKRNNPTPDKGDCVDCDLCVQVCPTGIDIRNGTQLECINCTACIDACNSVMRKLNLAEDLIGFKSEENIKAQQEFRFGKRIYGYAAILLVMVTATATLIIRRTDIETTVLRAGGTLYQERDNGTVSNLYNAELVNKTSKALQFSLEPNQANCQIQIINKENKIGKGESVKITFFVIKPKKDIKEYKSTVSLKVISDGKVLDKVETTFIAPPNI